MRRFQDAKDHQFLWIVWVLVEGVASAPMSCYEEWGVSHYDGAPHFTDIHVHHLEAVDGVAFDRAVIDRICNELLGKDAAEAAEEKEEELLLIRGEKVHEFAVFFLGDERRVAIWKERSVKLLFELDDFLVAL